MTNEVVERRDDAALRTREQARHEQEMGRWLAGTVAAIGLALATGLGIADLAGVKGWESVALAITAAVCGVAAISIGLYATTRVLFADEPRVDELKEDRGSLWRAVEQRLSVFDAIPEKHVNSMAGLGEAESTEALREAAKSLTEPGEAELPKDAQKAEERVSSFAAALAKLRRLTQRGLDLRPDLGRDGIDGQTREAIDKLEKRTPEWKAAGDELTAFVFKERVRRLFDRAKTLLLASALVGLLALVLSVVAVALSDSEPAPTPVAVTVTLPATEADTVSQEGEPASAPITAPVRVKVYLASEDQDQIRQQYGCAPEDGFTATAVGGTWAQPILALGPSEKGRCRPVRYTVTSESTVVIPDAGSP